ncbi:MAG: GAF domain-containing protein [Anaerolineae bacterium]|jgi:signal transduction histidine kinase|nr:GAF domain-containing protein [Anaerolineae bacterium]
MNPTQVGILFITAAGILVLGIRQIIRYIPIWRQRRAIIQKELEVQPTPQIVLERGGRVYNANQSARKLLDFSTYEPVVLPAVVAKFNPSEQFLNLCVNEGVDQLSLEGIGLVEVRSSRVNINNAEYQVLQITRVELMEEIAFKERHPRLPEEAAEEEGQQIIKRDALESILDIAESIHESFALDETVQNILNQFNRFIPSEFAELTLLNLDTGSLRAYRLVGRPGETKVFEMINDIYSLDGAESSFAIHLIEKRESLMVNNIPLHREYQGYSERAMYPFNSYLGSPLFSEENLVGTLSFGMLKTNAFTEGNRRLLEAFSRQIGVALANAQAFEARNLLVSEQNVAAKFNEDMQMDTSGTNIYERLVTSIVDLIDVDLLGFLIFDAEWNTLNAQVPFHGLSEQLVELYKVEIEPGSDGARLVQQRQELVFHQAPQDLNCRALGIDHLARAAGLNDLILMPLVTRGRFFGYLQAAWHRQLEEAELEQNLRLLRLIVQQAAPAVENRLLIDSSRERANRAETLQDIAALSNEASDVARFQEQTLETLVRLMDGNIVFLMKFDKEYSTLRLEDYHLNHFDRPFDPAAIRMPIQDAQFSMTVTARLTPAYTNDVHEQLFFDRENGTQLMPFYLNLFEQLDIRSAIGAPIAIRGNGIGEIWVLSAQPRHFRASDMRSLQNAANHLASFLDRMNLYAETDFSLRKQVDHLTILRRITNELSTTLDFDKLMDMLHAQAMRITNVNRGTFQLYDLKYFFDEHPRVQKYVGEAPEEIFQDMEAAALDSTKPVYYDNLHETHPQIAQQLGLASLVFVPVFYQDRPAAMLILKSEKEHYFDDLMLEVMESLSSQAAIAIGNTIQYDRQNRRGVLLRRELTTLENLRNCFTRTMRSNQLEDKLRSTAQALQQATPFKLVAVSQFNPAGKVMHRKFVIGETESGCDFIKEEKHTWEELSSLLNEELLISNSYYITHNRAPVVIEPVHMETLDQVTDDQRNLMAWRSGEIFLNILRDEQGNPMGMIQLDLPDDGFRPDQPAMDAVELFGSFMEYLLRSDETLQDTQEALSIVQAALNNKEELLDATLHEKEMLVSQTAQMQTMLHSMNDRMTMEQHWDVVVSSLDEVNSIEQAIETLAQEMLNQMEADAVLVAGYVHGEANLIHAVGALPEEVNFESLFGQRNPLREVLVLKHFLMMKDAETDHTWEDSVMMANIDHQSFLALPLEVEQDYVLSVLLVYQEKNDFTYFEESALTYGEIGHTLALRLSNIYRLSQTREQVENLNVLMQFSRKLSSVGPEGILDILTESIFDYLPAVEGCWVVLENPLNAQLEVANARGYSAPEELTSIDIDAKGDSMIARVFQAGESLLVDELNFASAYPMEQDELVTYQKVTAGQLPISSMFVPIQLPNRTLGVVIVDNFREVGAFSEQDMGILYSMGQQTALLLENSELYQEALERAEQLQQLSTAVQSVSTTPLNVRDMTQAIIQQIQQIVPAQSIIFWGRRGGGTLLEPMPYRLLDADLPERVYPTFDLERKEDYLEMGYDLMDYQYRANNAEIPQSIQELGMLEETYESHLMLPLLARNELMGLMLLENRRPNAFDDSTLQIAQAYASQCAISIHNAILFEQAQKRSEELNLESNRLTNLNEFALQLGGMTNLEDIYNLSLEQISAMLNVPTVSVVQVSRFDHIMLVAQRPEMTLNFTEELSNIPLLSGLRQSRAEYYISDVKLREDLGVLSGNYLEPLGTRSMLIVPVVVASQFWGWIWLQAPEEDAFGDIEMNLAHALANHIAISIVNATNFFEVRSMRESLEKLVEQRTRELEQGLEEYEMLNNNLQAILGSMADGVLVANDRGDVVMTNPAVSQIMRQDASMMIGAGAEQLASYLQSPDALNRFSEWARWATSGNVALMEANAPSMQTELEDGRIIFVQAAPVVREGKLLGSVTIMRDITAETVAERLKTEFVTNVSHELRTPITAIKGAVEVVLGRMTGDLNAQQEMFMVMARKNCDRLQTLVDDILEVSQIDAGQMEIHPATVDTHSMLTSLVEEVRARVEREGRDLQIHLDLPEHALQIEADEQRLAQVIRNLLSNAYTYTEDMGQITLRLRQRGNAIEVDVVDTGIGIPPEAADRIFERFYRGEDELVISSAGPGLGLWIARTIVEMHGGEIWFTSSGEPGEGTTFSFSVPMRQEEIVHA